MRLPVTITASVVGPAADSNYDGTLRNQASQIGGSACTRLARSRARVHASTLTALSACTCAVWNSAPCGKTRRTRPAPGQLTLPSRFADCFTVAGGLEFTGAENFVVEPSILNNEVYVNVAKTAPRRPPGQSRWPGSSSATPSPRSSNDGSNATNSSDGGNATSPGPRISSIVASAMYDSGTVSMWINPRSECLNSDRCVLFDFQYQLTLQLVAGRLYSPNRFDVPVPFGGGWHHIAFTFSSVRASAARAQPTALTATARRSTPTRCTSTASL